MPRPLLSKVSSGNGSSSAHLAMTMSLMQLQRAVAPYARQYSLKEACKRKKAQLDAKQIRGYDVGIKALLSGSKLLCEHSDAESVYFALPFFAKPPTCKLIYSTDRNRRSLSDLYESTMQTVSP
jgi:hypothetical protein